MNYNLKEAFKIAYERDMYTQWPKVTKPTDGTSAVWRKKQPGRKRVEDFKQCVIIKHNLSHFLHVIMSS